MKNISNYGIFVALLLTTSMAFQSIFGYILAVILLIIGLVASNTKEK